MSGIRVQLPEKLEKKFREAAMRRFGYGKGALSKAAQEAFQNWLVSLEKKEKFEGDPVEAIKGILKDLDYNSVELQHAVKEFWAKKHVPR
jgi:hypothetical protein